MTEEITPQPQQQEESGQSQRFWKVLALIVVLTASFVVIIAFSATSTPLLGKTTPVRSDSVFEAKALQEFKGGFEGAVYLDTNCVPVENDTKLSCVAIISRKDSREKYLYEHLIEIPCLNRDEQVRVEGTRNDIRIIRLSEPTMDHD